MKRLMLWLVFASFVPVGTFAWAQGPGGRPPGPPNELEGEMGPEEDKPPLLKPSPDNDKRIQEVLAVIREYDAPLVDKLDEIKAKNPKAHAMVIKRVGGLLMAVRHEKDKELAKKLIRGLRLEIEAKELSQRYREADEKDKPGIKKDLEAKVSELFDLKVYGQELRLKKMREEISRLEERIEKRKASKDKVVRDRVKEMTGETESWEW